MDDTIWVVNKQLKLCDWDEGDAVVYLQGAGDLHMVSGVTRYLLRHLLSGPKSLPELIANVKQSSGDEFESGFVLRHLTQLEALGMLGRTYQ